MATREGVLKGYREALPTGDVLGFYEAHRPLSNFHLEPFMMHGITWPSSENVYQFCKLQDPTGEDVELFRQCTPGHAKKAGNTLKRRENWEALKTQIMHNILECKFIQCPVARACLLGTTGKLVEVNWWGDTFWGVCGGTGENNLGRTLMDIRYAIQHGEL